MSIFSVSDIFVVFLNTIKHYHGFNCTTLSHKNKISLVKPKHTKVKKLFIKFNRKKKRANSKVSGARFAIVREQNCFQLRENDS